MMSDCKKILPLVMLLLVSLSADQALATGVSELAVSQSNEVPLVARDSREVRFSLTVSGACSLPGQTLALLAAVADTLVSVDSDMATGPQPLTVSVPVAQLSGMQRPLLCKRLNSQGDPQAMPLIRGAFSVQLTAICSGADAPETQRTVNTPLDVRIDCELSDDRTARPES